MNCQSIDFMRNQAYLDLVQETNQTNETKSKIATESIMLLMHDLAEERKLRRKTEELYRFIKLCILGFGIIITIIIGVNIQTSTNKLLQNMNTFSQDYIQKNTEKLDQQLDFYQFTMEQLPITTLDTINDNEVSFIIE